MQDSRENEKDDNSAPLVDRLSDIKRWSCHIHPSAGCSMAFIDRVQYHIVPVKEINKYAQSKYNSCIINNEFWEKLDNGIYLSAIGYCDIINSYKCMQTIFCLFKILDEESVVYDRDNTPRDMVKKHLITDCIDRVTLCNKHLIKPVARREKQFKYTSACWEKQILHSLFSIKTSKTTSPNVPTWVFDILQQHNQPSNFLENECTNNSLMPFTTTASVIEDTSRNGSGRGIQIRQSIRSNVDGIFNDNTSTQPNSLFTSSSLNGTRTSIGNKRRLRKRGPQESLNKRLAYCLQN